MERDDFFKRVTEELKKHLAERVKQANAELKQNAFERLENEKSIFVICMN